MNGDYSNFSEEACRHDLCTHSIQYWLYKKKNPGRKPDRVSQAEEIFFASRNGFFAIFQANRICEEKLFEKVFDLLLI